MEHHFIYFFVILASSIAALITFSIAAIIFYKERIEKKIDFNINVYKKYAEKNIFGDTIPFREIEPTTNAFDLFIEIFICEEYIMSYMRHMEEQKIKLEGLTYYLKVGLEAIKNVEFYVVNYRRSLFCFWGSLIFAILTIMFSTIALWNDNYATPYYDFFSLALSCSIISVLFIGLLLFNIFQEPHRKEHLSRIKENIHFFGTITAPKKDKALLKKMSIVHKGIQQDIRNILENDLLEKINNLSLIRRIFLLLRREGVRNLWTRMSKKQNTFLFS